MLRAAVQSHADQVAQSSLPERCPHCLEVGSLRRHELRPRTFWVVVGCEIERVLSCVMRVACKLCNKRSTVLPEFALPHKRYLRQEVLDRGVAYLYDESATYRSVAHPAFHNSEGSTRAATTVHRWIGFLGGLVQLLAAGTGLLLQADPSFSPLREMIVFSSRRYRTEARHEVLGRGHRWLEVSARFQSVLQRSMFPNFATPEAWS